jgi:hypothetical protein
MTDLQTNRPLLDTSEMLVVHTMFRRELGLAGGLVRGVPAGDRRRAAVVAAHLDLVETVLHHHHSSEDRLLWPRLLERVPGELAPVVELMETQHERVDQLLGAIAVSRPAWAAAPSDETGERLGRLYDELYGGLAEHLEAEEKRVLPLVARCITAAEWAELGESGRAGIARKNMALVFGMLMYDADPDVIARMLAPAPLPVRLLVPRLGRRAYRRHAATVHGTPTP